MDNHNFTEGNLRFTFPAAWPVNKYDECAFIRDDIRHLQQFQCVDFIFIKGNTLFLLEIKEFQGDRSGLAQKTRITADCCLPNCIKDCEKNHQSNRKLLHNAIIQKTKDTLLGLLLAWRMENTTLRPFATHATTPDRKIKLIFLLDSIRNGVSELDRDDYANIELLISQRTKHLVADCALLTVEQFRSGMRDVNIEVLNT